MAILFFSDVLRKVGLDPAKVKLIRHVMTDENFKECYKANMVREYTSHSVYRVDGFVADTETMIPMGLPLCEAKRFKGQNAFYHLEQVDLLKEYEGKLIIDWGNSARMWHQKGTTEKPIISLQPDEKKVFAGYEDLILTYDQIKEIIENPSIYEAWHTALSSVYAIYLIVDRENGRQYVGSAYGEDGLLGRWSCYVKTHHGNNKLMKEVVCNYPDRYHNFQFSIL